MSKKIARVMFAFIMVSIFAFAGMVLGLIIGMNIGGNYFTNFEFMGLRGYEATGTIGLSIGLTLGVFSGGFLAYKLLKRK